jgi:hypothetical protein
MLKAADPVPASAMMPCREAGVLNVFLSRYGKFVAPAPERTPTREVS